MRGVQRYCNSPGTYIKYIINHYNVSSMCTNVTNHYNVSSMCTNVTNHYNVSCMCTNVTLSSHLYEVSKSLPQTMQPTVTNVFTVLFLNVMLKLSFAVIINIFISFC